ncbi:MAG: hypothetical protein SNJ55_02295 [Chloroherpetonaceae bacterium]
MKLKTLLFSTISFCVATIVVTAQAIEQKSGISPKEQVRKAIRLHLTKVLLKPDSYEEEDWSDLTINAEHYYCMIHEYSTKTPSGISLRKTDYFVLDENFQVIEQIDISCVKRFTWRRALRAIHEVFSGSENKGSNDLPSLSINF